MYSVQMSENFIVFCPLSMSMMMMMIYKSNNHVCINVMTINSIQAIVSLPAQSSVSMIIGPRVFYHQSLRQPQNNVYHNTWKEDKINSFINPEFHEIWRKSLVIFCHEEEVVQISSSSPPQPFIRHQVSNYRHN